MYPKISVIIPVYNVEQYLVTCIESVLEQDYKNIEVILIDDGSPDRCPEICDEYERKDVRVKVVHKRNGGLSDARNVGIEVSTGDYVMFLDSDDWIVEDCIKQIASLVQKASVDVVIGRFQSYPENGAVLNEDAVFDAAYFDRSADEVRRYLFSLPFLFIACRYIVRREFILKNNLKFYIGILHEDEEWTPRILCMAESFMLFEQPFYCYRKRQSNSITSKKDIQNIKSYLTIINSLETYSKNNRNYSEYFRSRSIAMFSQFISNCKVLSKEEIKHVAKIIKCTPNLLQFIKDSNTKLARLINLLGIERGIVFFVNIQRFISKMKGILKN